MRPRVTRPTRRSTWSATRTGAARADHPDWDFRPAYLDNVSVQEGFADTVSASKKVLAGRIDGQRRLHDAAERHQVGVQDEEPGQLTLTAERW